MIIDFHVHIFPPNIKADRSSYLERDPIFRELYSSPKARIATADDLLISMDQAGIDVAVLQGFGWRDLDLCRETNDYLCEAAARYPQRLIPFCTTQPLAGPPARTEVEGRLAGPAPVRGIGELRPDDQGYATPHWEELRPVAALAQQRGLPLLVHASEPVGRRYPGKGGMTPQLLAGLAETFPDCTLVLAHLGGGLPFYAAMPEVAKALEHSYIDTAAWTLLYRPAVFPALTWLFDPARILFGSDFPLVGQARAVEQLRAVELAEPFLNGILGDNAARLLGLGGG